MTADPTHPASGSHDRVGGAAVQARLERLLAAPGLILIVSDFDGTLARGSGDPTAAAMEPLARRSLRRLARLGAERPGRLRTTILTGRTVLDAATRIRVGGIGYLGDHGLQSGWLARGADPASLVTVYEPGFEAQVPAARALATGVGGRLGHPRWLYVELKGPSVAFHFRGAADRDAARDAVNAALRDTELEVRRPRPGPLPRTVCRRPATHRCGRQGRGHGSAARARASGCRRRPR